MTESKFTPGPWFIDRRSETHVKGQEDRSVCSTGGYASNMPHDRDTYVEENIANARLIAAAPDLLAALQRITEDPNSSLLWSETYNAITAAIKKAVGDE